MNTIEIITPNQSLAIPRIDTPESLVEELHSIVRAGITSYYNDVAWVYYFGPAEELEVEQNPGFQRLISTLDTLGTSVTNEVITDISKRPNVRPHSYHLVRNLAAPRDAAGNGGFFDISTTSSRRYVALPAHNTPYDGTSEVEVDLSHGICFNGEALVAAMFKDGFDTETILHRERSPFPAYREKQFGEFFMKHVLL